jgi:hypothetical protein
LRAHHRVLLTIEGDAILYAYIFYLFMYFYSVRDEIRKTIELPIRYPELFHIASNTSIDEDNATVMYTSYCRNGILLYGPPGRKLYL